MIAVVLVLNIYMCLNDLQHLKEGLFFRARKESVHRLQVHCIHILIMLVFDSCSFVEHFILYHIFRSVLKILYMGLDARKPVFGGLQITPAQTSLRFRAVWSAPLLFPFWKESYLGLLQAKFRTSR